MGVANVIGREQRVCFFWWRGLMIDLSVDRLTSPMNWVAGHPFTLLADHRVAQDRVAQDRAHTTASSE